MTTEEKLLKKKRFLVNLKKRMRSKRKRKQYYELLGKTITYEN